MNMTGNRGNMIQHVKFDYSPTPVLESEKDIEARDRSSSTFFQSVATISIISGWLLSSSLIPPSANQQNTSVSMRSPVSESAFSATTSNRNAIGIRKDRDLYADYDVTAFNNQAEAMFISDAPSVIDYYNQGRNLIEVASAFVPKVSFDLSPAYGNIEASPIDAGATNEWEASQMLQKLIKTRDNIERQVMYIASAITFGLLIAPVAVKAVSWNTILPSVLLSLSLTGFMWIRRQSRR